MSGFNEIVGGKWWKTDFHLHSPGSYDYGHGDVSQKKVSPEEYLKKCMSLGLDCIVVSDHNTFDWIPKLREALNSMRANQVHGFRELTIFPGIEINVQGNIHLLGVFDPSMDEKTLIAIPLLIGYDKETETTTKSINEIIDIISHHNGIAIPAHVDAPSGLFYNKQQPSIIKQALSTGKLLALEVIGDNIDNGILKESKLKLSFVVGSDSHSLETIGEKFTWVKMGEPNIEALRLALFDTEDGVIRSKDINGNPNERHGRIFIKSITISNGKYIGRKEIYKTEFSPWLNCIIGGRGSGKSSLLKFIRLVMDRGDELPGSLQEEYKDFVKVPSNRTDLGMLQKQKEGIDGTRVELVISVDGVDHIIAWKDNTILEYNSSDDEWVVAQSLKERFPVRMFAQKQLFEMTGDTRLLFDFLDSQWDSSLWTEKMNELRRNYFALFRERGEIVEKQNRLKQKKVQLEDIKKKISFFETEGTKVVLLEKENLKKQKIEVEKIYSQYSDFIRWANEFEKFSAFTTPVIPDFIEEKTSNMLRNWIAEVERVFKALDGVVKPHEIPLVSKEGLLDSLPLEGLIIDNNNELEHVLEQLRKAGIDDVDRYEEFLGEKERVEREISEFGDCAKDIEKCNSLLNDKLLEWEKLAKERYVKRNKVLQQWNDIGALKISLIPFANLVKNEETLRNIIRKDTGFSKEILEYDEDGNLTKTGLLYFMSKEEELSEKLSELYDMREKILRKSTNDWGKRFNDYLSKTIVSIPEIEAELEMWLPEDALKLELNMNKTGKPKYRSIDAGSPGQRTSAILSLILGISNIPIIIDQPEDDLDTRNITDIIVAGINEMKKKQQIILVTHNPNIVVNSNSEQVIHLDYRGGQIENICSGALQKHTVRDAICEVMEGGKEALEKRYYRIFKALENN